MYHLLLRFYDENNNSIHFDTSTFKKHSMLSLLGYSVRKKGKDKSERQEIIQFIIKNEIMCPVEIKNHLNHLIRFNGKKAHMSLAVNKWREDLNYINDILLEKGCSLPVLSDETAIMIDK